MIVSAVDRYNRNTGQYPTTEQGLAVLPSHAAGLVDLWGNPYQYARPGKNGRNFDIWSIGPDGIDGTTDDVGHWMERSDL